MKNKALEHPLIQGIISRFLLTFELFTKNELANHAAAGAYGFFLSAAPALLLVVFIITTILAQKPSALVDFYSILSSTAFGDLHNSTIDITATTSTLLKGSGTRFSGLIAIVNLLWTGRVFALSLQRGLRVIFPMRQGPIQPIRDNLIPFAIELAAIVYALLYIGTTQVTITIIKKLGIHVNIPILIPILQTVSFLLPVVGLGILAYGSYRLVPQQAPNRVAALEGALICVLPFGLTAMIFKSLVNPARYNLIYGTLGNVVILLANVYFFFTFYFLGAQFAMVSHSFDALTFSRFRKIQHSSRTKGREQQVSSFQRRLFGHPSENLKKYLKTCEDGTTI
ncbi:MAG: YihY/virulence factor BrkB family protein, partial [Termitinemataceae bacterium]